MPAAVPNIIAALVVRARTFTDLSQPTDPVRLCRSAEAGRKLPPRAVPRIGGRVRKAPDDNDPWPMPTYAIVFRKAGGMGENPDSRLAVARIQVDCYGPTAHDADTLWRTTHPFLVGEIGPGLPPSGFVAAHTCVYSIVPQGAEQDRPEPGTEWPRTLCMYLVQYSVVPR